MPLIHTLDAHAAGEPCRVVIAGLPRLHGDTVKARRTDFRARHDWIRTALMCEPRGHDGMFGALLLPPEREGSEFGLVFFDPVGYLDGCGHGTLCAVAAWRRLTGEMSSPIAIDNPDGSVTRVLSAEPAGGDGATRSTLEMPVARVVEERTAVPGWDGLDAGLARCGNLYLLVRAESAGIHDLPGAGADRIREVGGALRAAAVEGVPAGALRPDGGDDVPEELEVAFYARDPSRGGDAAAYSTAILFSRTQIDRSPCGTGSCALLALLAARGDPAVGAGSIRTRGPLGEPFELASDPGGGEGGGRRIRLTGTAWLTGTQQWILDESDPFRAGYRYS